MKSLLPTKDYLVVKKNLPTVKESIADGIIIPTDLRGDSLEFIVKSVGSAITHIKVDDIILLDKYKVTPDRCYSINGEEVYLVKAIDVLGRI